MPSTIHKMIQAWVILLVTGIAFGFWMHSFAAGLFIVGGVLTVMQCVVAIREGN